MRVSVKTLLTLISTLQKIPVEARVPKGAKGSKGAKGAKGNKDAKVTRYIGSKGQLGDKVFSRTCVQSSLTPEEGPSCLTLSLTINVL